MGTSKGGPAGSLQPLDANKGKWTDGMGALEIGTLSALATDINKAVDQTVKQVARGKIKVGKLLLEARAQFQDDAMFGKWRREHTLIQSKQHAHYLMQVADQFGNATVLIEGTNYSVMQELVTADQADIQWVVDRIDAGDPPKVAEVRAKVNEGKVLKGTSKKGTQATPNNVISPHANINALVPLSLTMRINKVAELGIEGTEGDLIILGMDPDPQVPCHKETLFAVRDYWQEEAQTDAEMQAINDSFDRVEEHFRNW